MLAAPDAYACANCPQNHPKRDKHCQKLIDRMLMISMGVRGLVRRCVTGPVVEAGAIDDSATLAELGAPDERDLLELRLAMFGQFHEVFGPGEIGCHVTIGELTRLVEARLAQRASGAREVP